MLSILSRPPDGRRSSIGYQVHFFRGFLGFRLFGYVFGPAIAGVVNKNLLEERDFGRFLR